MPRESATTAKRRRRSPRAMVSNRPAGGRFRANIRRAAWSDVITRQLDIEPLEERALLTAIAMPTVNLPFEVALVHWHGQQHQAAAGRWIVSFDNLPGPRISQGAQAAATLAAAGLSDQVSMLRNLGSDGLFLLDVTSDMDPQAVYAALQQLPGIRYAEPDFLLSTTAIPNDPSFGQLFGLNNTGQTVNGDPGTLDADIDAAEAWDGGTGSSNVVVGVIDTGIDYTHPDLVNNIWTNPGEIAGNGIDDDANGYIDDVHGYDFFDHDSNPMDENSHGTHVSGTIGAEGNNGIGVAGVNWDVSLMALKIGGAGPSVSLDAAVEAINYVSMMSDRGVNVRVTNNSWGGPGFLQSLFDAIAGNQSRGVLFVASAGNATSDNDIFPAYPASYDLDNIISVAATTNDDTLANFSNFGQTSVDLAAPGVNILSTVPNGNYEYFQGTSMASPHVAGAAALAFSRAPNANYADVRKAILDGVDIKPNLAGVVATGGRLNLVGMLRELTGVSVSDASATLEGDIGTKNLVFNVTLTGAISQPVTVQYATIPGIAVAPGDFSAQSGTLTFEVAGPRTIAVSIAIKGDTQVEPNETFFLQLSNVTNASLRRGLAIGTILNDDIDLSIDDVTVVEGDSGTNSAVFTVSGLGLINQSVTIVYTTLNGTAIAASDYQPRGGTLTLAPRGGTARVTVPIVGDKFNEGTETFTVMLTSTDTGRIIDNIGVGTIVDNDLLPAFYVNDVRVTTTEEGQREAVFTVAIDAPSGREVSVDFTTVEGTATPVDDYTAQFGTLSFAPGVTTRQVAVLVRTDTDYAPNKKFSLKLSNALNAQMNDPVGVCTIIFADAPLNERIIDDGDPLYSQTAGWVTLTNTMAYQTDYTYHAPGVGANSATWTFDDLPARNYQVLTRWSAFVNRATNAPYAILDGANPLGTVVVNQQLAPAGDQSDGMAWQSLGMFSISTGTLAVRLTDNANGYVIADAVRIVADGIGQQVPEMDVAGFERSIGTIDLEPAIEDGTDFGTVATASNSLTHSFTVTNTGNADLHLSGSPRVQVTDGDVGDFTVLTQPSAVIAPGFPSSFQIIFHPSQPGERWARISIDSNDGDEQPYIFDVRGFGGETGPGQFTIDDGGSGFQAFGNWTANANSFSYAAQMHSAAAGQGADRSDWTFNDLAPGQYDVFTTWVPFGNRAANAPFTIADGDVSENTISIDQRQAANDVYSDGVMWELLTSLNVTTGVLKVGLSNAAAGFVIADAVRIVRHGAQAQAAAPPVIAAAPSTAHNVAMPLDVNGDGRISGADAVVVISELLTRSGAGSSPSAVASPAVMTATATTTAPVRYVDVNGDGRITPSDALAVISYLLHPIAPLGASASPLASPAAVVTDTAALAAVDAAISQMDDTDLADVARAQAAADSAAPTAPVSAEEPSPATVLAPLGTRAPLAASTSKGGNSSCVALAETVIDE